MKRKTTIPIKTGPVIVEWLLKNCTADELSFMATIASDRRTFALFNSVLIRLTDYNIYDVFYKAFTSDHELMLYRAEKRGEVAGLKAFLMACQTAREELQKREEKDS